MEMITGINFDGMINAQVNSEENPIEIDSTSNERVTVQSSEGNVHQENNNFNENNNSNEDNKSNENDNQMSLTEIDINNFISEVKGQIPSQQTSSHRTIPGQQQTQDGRKMKSISIIVASFYFSLFDFRTKKCHSINASPKAE